MTLTIWTKDKSRLRVNDVSLPLATSELLGSGIDVMTLPEGHLSCAKCGKHLFECWVYLDNHRIEMGCMNCGASYRLLFPLDVDLLSPFSGKSGRFSCLRRKKGHFLHQNKGMVLIHNVDTICIGCELCNSEVQIKLKKAEGLILADG